MADFFGSGFRYIVLTPGVGDDPAIIEAEGGGAVFDLDQLGSVSAALCRLSALLGASGHRARIHALAVRHWSLHRAREAYRTLLPGPLSSPEDIAV